MSSGDEPTARAVLDDDGPAAPPRRNGELVFEAPWQSRLFGVTMALHRSGAFAWEDFRRLLIAEIREWDRTHAADEPYVYYERWAAALERLLAAKQLCHPSQVDQRSAELARRQPGHDH